MAACRRLCAAFLLMGICYPSLASAQIRAGTITGTVADTSKALVPGASVVVTNEATNIATELVTNEAGQFTALYLPAGTYKVEVTLTGFATFRRTGIALASTETVRVPVELTMAQLGETVQVSAEAPLLQTDRTSVSGAVGAEMIEALPNITQNPLQYAMLQAGAIGRNSTQDTQSLNSFGIGVDGRRNWSAVGINGGRAFTNDIQLDGLPVMGGGYNEAAVVPNTEGLQEVRVISNNFSAEYGRGQAVISMSTKSGTNAFHGNGAYLMRHEGLNANSFSNNAQGIAKSEFRVNDVGGSIGGPIRRNKLFFFSSYHGLRNNQGSTTLATVPTALERVGNFSQTFIRDESGNPVPARIFDPFNVVQEGPDLYRRAEVPNAIITNPHPAALQMFSYYPQPNRTPDDVFNTNNFEASTIQTVRRHSCNNRVDLRLGKHSIYASGGISYATITTPRPFGESPFNGAAGIRSDNNPYFQIGDTIVLSNSVVIDVRYGVSHIDTKAFTGDKEGFTDFTGFGVPANLQPLMAFAEAAPVVNPNGFNGGNGGGSNWTALSAGTFGTKLEVQSNHSFAGSITKVRGRWTHKAGAEYRNLLSHYADPEQASVAMPSPTAHNGGNFNFEYVTANGGAAQQTRINAQRGVNGAAMLLGAGLWTIRPGANVLPYFSQKYFAVYSQNDWRPSSKLTINLGLRWELQPGPTERENRMSAWDFTKTNPFGTQGAVAFPGEDGYSRNLWDTEYNNWGPRVGAAYTLNPRTVLRGGFGITYLPSNTGYFSGPNDYGSANFSGGVSQIPYGTNPRGVVAGKFSDPSPIVAAVGGDAGRAAGLRHRRVAVHPPVQERPLDAVERLRRTVAGDELDGVGRLHGVAQPQPAESVVPDPEPAEHRPGGSRPMACDVHRQQRHGEPSDAAGAEPLSALERAAAAVRRRARCGDDYPPDDALPVSPACPRHRQQLGRERRLSRDAVARGAALRAGRDARRDLHVVAEHGGHEHRYRGRPGLQRRRHRHQLGHHQPREQPDDRPERRAAPAGRDVPLRMPGHHRGAGSTPMRVLKAIAADWQIGRYGDLADRLPDRDQRRQHRRRAGASGSCRRRGPPAAGESVGLVRRPDGGDAAERTRDHAGEPHLPQIQPRCVRRPRGDHAEWGGRGGSVLVGQRVRRPTTRSAPTRASTSTSACAATSRSRRIGWSSVWT